MPFRMACHKQTTTQLQDRYDAPPQFMTSCDSNIPELILEWREVVALLEARGEVINDKFKVLWRAFELVKDENFSQSIHGPQTRISRRRRLLNIDRRQAPEVCSR